MGQKIAAFAFLSALFAGCATGPAPVVNAGSSDPGRSAPPVALLPDRTHIPAWEFGLCETDADCVPGGCTGGLCAPAETAAVCSVTEVGMCLATVPSGQCGCVEGSCRWTRSIEVMQCAGLAAPRPQTQPFLGFDRRSPYPSSQHHR